MLQLDYGLAAIIVTMGAHVVSCYVWYMYVYNYVQDYEYASIGVLFLSMCCMNCILYPVVHDYVLCNYKHPFLSRIM